MIRTLLVDDDDRACLAARSALRAFPDVQVEGAFNGKEPLFAWLADNDADLIFLDIELNRQSGFDIAAALRAMNPDVLIIFLTGHSSYAVDSFDFQPLFFLTKPIQQDKLVLALDLARQQLSPVEKAPSAARMLFRLDGGYRMIDPSAICCIERLNRKNYMHTLEGRFRMMNYTMKELEEMLQDHGFFMAHQSFLINLNRVESVYDSGVQLYEAVLRGMKMPIPVSRNRYEGLLQKLSK